MKNKEKVYITDEGEIIPIIKIPKAIPNSPQAKEEDRGKKEQGAIAPHAEPLSPSSLLPDPSSLIPEKGES